MERSQALVVDKDPSVRAVIRDVLEEREVMTLGASSGAEAIETMKSRAVHLLFVDPTAPGVVTLDLLGHAARLHAAPVTILLTTPGTTVEEARLIDAGIFDRLPKPLVASQVTIVAQRCVRQLELLSELRRLREELQSREGYHRIVGRSSTMERFRQQLDLLAPRDASVWFRGETGTGKELAARILHACSPRREHPFIVVNCAGLSSASWDGLWADHGDDDGSGLLAQAGGGSIYLDDLPALSIELQQRLIEALDGNGAGARSAQLPRFLAASKGDPRRSVEEGQLEEPLYRHLSTTQLELPRLCDRSEDIALLARHFIFTICEINNLPPIQLSPDALGVLNRYPWPGNVQELRNAVEHAVILAADGTIRPRDLPDRIREGKRSTPPDEPRQDMASRKFREVKREVVESFERAYLCELLERYGGNVTSASRQAGMLRSALQRLLRKYKLRSVDFRKQLRVSRSRKNVDESRAD